MLAFKKKGLLLVVILLFLIAATLAQRGGGRSRSSSSRSSRSRSSFRSWNSKKKQTNCTTVDGKTTCYNSYNSAQLQEFGWISILAVCFFAAVGLKDYFTKGTKAERKKETVQVVMNDFISRMEQEPSTLDLGLRQEIIGKMKGQSFNMTLTTRKTNNPIQCNLKVTDLQKITDDRYRIQLKGNDEVGSSKFLGLLIFKADGLVWKLSKEYDNKRQAGQTDSFQNLFYEGSGQPGRMEGIWAYQGHQSQMEYSGTWIMVPS